MFVIYSRIVSQVVVCVVPLCNPFDFRTLRAS
jgi:hypothetical protein